MTKRTAHRCTDYFSMWKVDSTGFLKCVCGNKTHESWRRVEVPNPSALTDDHSAGKADTSREAFASTDRVKRMVEVTELLRASFNGLTADEAADAMGVGQATTSARFNELKRAGMVTKVERRLTRTGRSAWAYRIKAGM